MFSSLSDKLSNALGKFRNKGKLTEADIKAGMREIKLALLEADVSFKVTKEFVARVSERAVGADVMESLVPSQQIVKIVNEELVETSDEERNAHKKKFLKNCLEETKDAKIKEINSFCSKLITAGVVIDGERYSYTLEDQSNILAALQNVKITGMSVPYHSNGNNFRLFSPAEIISIYIAQYKNLIQHTVYTNQLRQYIKNELSIIEDIKAVKYGDALTGNYLNNYNSIINQAMCDIESRLNTQDNI